MHADPTVRAIASEVLRRFIRAFPSRRNEVLVGMAAFAAKIPDEFPEVISFAFSAKRLSSFCMHVELNRHLCGLLQGIQCATILYKKTLEFYENLEMLLWHHAEHWTSSDHCGRTHARVGGNFG